MVPLYCSSRDVQLNWWSCMREVFSKADRCVDATMRDVVLTVIGVK